VNADNPAAAGIVMYSTRFCPFCIRARRLLAEKNLPFTDIPVDGDPAKRSLMEARSGRHTVPQIWIGDRHIGGFDDLWLLEQQGDLDALLVAKEIFSN
jgi:glutaredoxin 3